MVNRTWVYVCSHLLDDKNVAVGQGELRSIRGRDLEDRFQRRAKCREIEVLNRLFDIFGGDGDLRLWLYRLPLAEHHSRRETLQTWEMPRDRLALTYAEAVT
jgi:hypothetical protein